MLITAGYYVSIALRVFVCLQILRRWWVWRLSLFTLFVFSSTALSLALAFHLSNPARYTQILNAVSPFVSALQGLAVIEAFAWFVWSLPKFRAIGLFLLLVISTVAAGIGTATTPEVSRFTRALAESALFEHKIGIPLGAGLVLTLAIFSIFSRISSSARWHAGSLCILALCGALGWRLTNNYVVIFGCVAAFGMWVAMVSEGPEWALQVPRAPGGGAMSRWKQYRRQLKEASEKLKASGR